MSKELEDLHQKLLAAQGLISQGIHRMNRAWEESYSDLIDASNMCLYIERRMKKPKKRIKSNEEENE